MTIEDLALAAGIAVVVAMAACAIARAIADQRHGKPTPRPQLVGPPVPVDIAEVWIQQTVSPDPASEPELAPTVYVEDDTARTARGLFESAP